MKHLSAKGWIVATVLSALPGAVLAEPVNISYLTHWSPETVALLETAAKEPIAKTNPDVTVTVRAVPFGDLLTTLALARRRLRRRDDRRHLRSLAARTGCATSW